MVEASYFAHNYQLTARYLDLNVHYVTVVMLNLQTPEAL